MKLTFLGTGSSLGVPMIGCGCEVCSSDDPRDKRLRTSALIQAGNETILIDAGPDFREQALRHGIDKVDAILLTHPHRDHIGGLDDTRALYYAMGKKPLAFYAEDFTIRGVRKYYDYLFPASGKTDYHGAPQSRWHEIRAGETFDTGHNSILPLRAWHGPMPVTAYKIGRLLYMTDVKTVPAETKSHIDRDTILVLSALHRKPHHLHFNLDEALAFIDETKPRHAYLIHMGHWMGKHAEVEKQLPPHVRLAYDGLTINI